MSTYAFLTAVRGARVVVLAIRVRLTQLGGFLGPLREPLAAHGRALTAIDGVVDTVPVLAHIHGAVVVVLALRRVRASGQLPRLEGRLGGRGHAALDAVVHARPFLALVAGARIIVIALAAVAASQSCGGRLLPLHLALLGAWLAVIDSIVRTRALLTHVVSALVAIVALRVVSARASDHLA